MMLAQVDTEVIQEVVAEAVKAAAPEIAKGTADAMRQEPGTGLMLWAVIVLAVVGVVGLVLLLRYLNSRDRDLKDLFGSFSASTEKSAAACHIHSQQMANSRDKHVEALTGIAHDLKDGISDLKEMTKDAKETSTATRQFVAEAMSQLRGPK